MLDESDQKPNKICVDKGSEFYNISMKSWLKKSDKEIFSIHNRKKKDLLLLKIYWDLKE